jgi:hypothetical protein
MAVSIDDARRIGDALSVNWDVVPVEVFQTALITKLEHTDVTHGDPMTTGRIALAHLREDPDYYVRLARAEAEAEAYWSTHDKPSPTLGGGGSTHDKPSPTLGGGGSTTKVAFVVIVVIVLVVIAYFAWRYWKKHYPKDGFFARDALGYEIPMPGDPNRNILRRSQPYPPGRYPRGGLGDFYFQFDPAYSSSFETDYCWHAPEACAGFALEPFRSSRVFY